MESSTPAGSSRDGDSTPDPGEGLEGVLVELYDSTGTTLLATATTDENGNYTFGGVADGDYVFRVKGANHDGVWNETGTSIRVSVLPPAWKTWWAYTLYVLAVIGIFLGWRSALVVSNFAMGGWMMGTRDM